MNIKWGLFCFFLISGLLLTNFTAFGQKKHSGLKAYLILNNQNVDIAKDSLFEKGFRIQLRSVLKKKNITLVPNEAMEAPEQMHLYIQVNIADSLKISFWKSMANQGIGVVNVLPKNKVYQYKNEQDITRKVISYVKKNI